MKSTWSVFTGPYLVATVVPSIKRQQIALHAFAADVGAAAHVVSARADLVDLVEEDDAGVFDRADGVGSKVVVVDELVAFFGDQDFVAVANGHAARLHAAAHRFLQHFADVDAGAAHAGAHAGDLEHRHAAAGVGDHDLDFAFVQFVVAQLAAEAVARGGR